MVKVGVILNQKEEIASLYDGVQVAIFEKIALKWTKVSEVNINFSRKESMSQMRDYLAKLVIDMQDCKILIGTIIIGISYMILDQNGFLLCEADEMSDELFTAVVSDYETLQEEKINRTLNQLEDYPTSPYETQEKGIYELNIIKLQELHPEISSKKALIPFLKKIKFIRLDVFCSHVMPWFDYELAALGLTYSVEKLVEDGYKVEVIASL